MKAIIKHTDKIVDVEWSMRGWLWDSPEGKRTFDAEELVFFDNDNVDWQSFRAEAAKDILCAMIQGGYDYSRTKSQSELSVKYADELIKQLKEKEA